MAVTWPLVSSLYSLQSHLTELTTANVVPDPSSQLSGARHWTVKARLRCWPPLPADDSVCAKNLPVSEILVPGAMCLMFLNTLSMLSQHSTDSFLSRLFRIIHNTCHSHTFTCHASLEDTTITSYLFKFILIMFSFPSLLHRITGIIKHFLLLTHTRPISPSLTDISTLHIIV